MAKKKSTWELTDEQRVEFQQAYLSEQTAENHEQRVSNARDVAQNYANHPYRTPQWSERRIAMQNYQDALRNYDTYMRLGGSVTPAQQSTYQKLYNQFEDAQNKLQQQRYMQSQVDRQGFGYLGMQTAAGIGPNGTQINHDALNQHLRPGRGLIDFSTGYPTAANQQAAQKNAMRKQYQNIQTQAGQEAARWGAQNQTDVDELDTVRYWHNIVRNLPQSNDARISASNSEWMRQAAAATGIASYTDASDLNAQLVAKESQLQAKSGWSERMVNRNAGRQMTARAYEYQLDNPGESVDANYYLALRDQSQGKPLQWMRYNSAYSNQLYQDQKNEDILAIRGNPTTGPIYQEAMEASRNAGRVATLRAQAHGERQDYGGISEQTEAEIRKLAQEFGIVVGQGDDALEAALEQVHQQQSHTVNTNIARLQAQGYDPERLRQYIQQALNEQRMDEQNAQAREFAAEHPGAASVGSSFTNLLSGGGYIATAPQAIGNALAGLTGEYDNYVPIDTNSPAFDQAQYVMAVRDEVSRNIVENGGSDFLYGLGMSMLDNVVQMAVGATLMGGAGAVTGQGARAAIQSGMQSAATASLATMGLSAASQELVRLTEQGVSSDQAFALATVKGATEIVTEKIGIDNFVANLGKKSTGNFVQQIVGMAAQQSAAEGGEEIIAEVAGLYADWLILQEESDIAKTIEAGRLNGKTESEALWDAFEKYALQVLEAGAAGALSGLGFGAMSTVGMVADAVSPAATGARIRAEGNEETLGAVASAFGVAYSPDMTDRQIGKTYRAVQKAGAKMQRDMQYGMSMEAYAKEKGYDPKTAKALARSWDAYHSVYGNDMSSREFAATWNSMKAAGQVNMRFEDAVAELGETKLGNATLQNAYKAGQALYTQAQRAAKKASKAAPAVAEKANEIGVELAPEMPEAIPVQTELVQRNSANAMQHAQTLMSERINVNGLSDDVVESFYDEIDSDIATERQGALAMARMLTGVSKNISQVILVDRANYDAEGHVRTLSNGMWDPTNRTITIDINAGRLNVEQQMTFMTRAMSHEITHSIKTSAPSQYAELERFVLREMDKQANLDKLIEAKIEDYAKEGIELDRQGAIDELVAESCEQMLERTDVLNKLAQENRTLWEKIRDYIKNAIAKLKALYKGMKANSPEARMLQGVIDGLQAKWDAAFTASLTAEVTETNATAQHSIAGKNAAIADIVSMENAVRMEEAGHTAPEIYNDTGWFRGADNMWRFEIDDSTMRYYRAGDAKFRKDHPGYVRYQELMEKFLYGYITEDEAQEMRESIYRYEYNRLKERVDRGNAHLDDILDHDTLFAAYPALRDVRIEFAETREGLQGVYSRRDNKIVLSEKLRREPEATLIHEIQHAIQAMEGFAFGASRAYWKEIIDNGGKIDSKRLRDATSAVRKFEGIQGNKEIVDARNRLNSAWEEGAKAGAAMYAQLESEGIAEKVDAYEYLLWEQSNAGVAFLNSTPMELYQNTAGEQEARDVSERRTMTSEQRKGKMPQTGTKDTVFAEGSSASASDSSMKTFSKDRMFTWGLHDGIFNNDDWRIIDEAVAKIFVRGYRGYSRSANGEYIVDTNNKIVFVSGNYENPIINRVVVLNDKYETNMAFAKGEIIDDAIQNGSLDISLQVVEAIEGRGYATLRTLEDSIAAQRQRLGDEGTAGKRNSRTTRKGKRQYQVNIHTEMDRAYEEALNSGNMDAAQRLVEQAAATAGYWRSRWHETKPESDFHVFNINRADNASADNQTPYGIFTKAHDRTVGLGGKQMRLFVRADRILRFRDRDTMKQQMPEEYKALLRRLEEVDAKYGAEAEEMEDQFFWDIEEWLEAQPNEDELRKRIDPAKPFYESIGDAMPQELIDIETRMTLHSEEWHEAENVEILAAKEWLTKWLPANGYDAMELEYDNGAGDRVTDALIVLSEDQVKLADVITRDDDGNIIPLSERFKAGNKDIRYQISRDTASNMDLLMGASMDGLSKAEADHLLRYRDRVNEIRQNQRKIDELKAEELTADVNAKIKRLENQNSLIYRKVNAAEQTGLMQRIIERERAAGDIEVQRMDNRVADLEDEIDELEQKIRNAKLAGQMGQGRRDAATLRKTEERLNKRNEKQRQAASDKATKQKQQAAERLDAQKQKYSDKLKEQRTQAKQAAADARLAGQMEQGRRDAVALQRTVEEYEARLESKRRELRIARESLDKRIAQMQESRVKSMDNRHRTQMRHKIRKVVKELDGLLLRGTKDRNIRDSMKAAVASALEAINMDTGDYEGRIAKLDEAIAAATDPVVIETLTESRERLMKQGSNMEARLTEMKNAYATFSKDTTGNYNSAYDEVVQSYIDATIEKVGATPLWDMSMEQLESVYNMYKMILTDIQQANKMVRDEKNRTIYSMGNAVLRELDHKKRHELQTRLGEFAKQFGWNNMKPVYAFETIGSNTLMELYENVRGGEDTWARDVSEARAFYQERAEKYGLDKWDTKTRHTFYSRSGKEFSLDVNQIMSLYAYSKRSQADEHLQRGGFVFDSAIEVTEKKKGLPIKYKVNTKQAYGIDPLTLNDIIATLTDEQRNFVDEMQAYLSDTMGAKGNEVSLDMYGVRLFNEQNYFPLKTSKQFLFEQNEVAGEVKLKNSGFSKHTTPQASNPIILSNFMDVWGKHVNDMSMYHAFVIPLENFNRVYNYQTLTTDEAEPDSVKGTLSDIYGDAPVNYIKQLLVDLNGGARADTTASIIDWGLSKFKSAAVMASASVIIQQPTAIIRALAYINPVHFGAANKQWHKNAWEELKQYAPVAIIKEMGRFDTNMGRSTTDWIIAEDYTGLGKVGGFVLDGEYRNDVFSRPAAFADEIGWLRIWAAVKSETKEKTDLKPGTKEFLEYCGNRFTYIIERTQVYDSVLARSAMMRSKDTGMKMATAFMAEPTTTMNMLVHAVQQFSRGYKGAATKTVSAVVTSLVVNSILDSLVYAARDDDEDETYAEKYFQALSERLKTNIFDVLLLNTTPFFRDVLSIFQGYDVERTDMSVVGDIHEAVMAWQSDTKTLYEKAAMTAEQVLRFFGLPVKNIRRDTEALINVIRTAIGEGIWSEGDLKEGWHEGWTGEEITSGQKLYEAYTEDDKAAILRLEADYKELYGEDWYKQIQSELREQAKKLYLAGELSYEDASDFLIEYGIELSASVERQHDSGTITDDEYLKLLEDAAYWMIKGWDTNAEDPDASTAKYADLNAAISAGGDITAASEELLAHGESEADIESAAASHIRELYRNGEIDRDTAEDYLAEYANITDSKDLYEWFTESDHWIETGESDFGAYGPVYDALLNGGDVNGAIDAMVDAGWTEAAIEDNIRTKTKEWVLGTASDGNTITPEEARNILSNYGGVDAEDLDAYVAAYNFWLDNPEYVDDFSIEQANDYLEYGTGIDIGTFLDFREAKSGMVGKKDANGETISGSVKAEAMAYIDALPITNAQKDQLYLMYWSETRIYEAPWH